MYNLDEHFKIDVSKSVAVDNIYKGQKYRITILSDVLIRFEYNEAGKFNDYPTLFALNRQFSNKVELTTIKEDNNFLYLQNKYFTLEYSKENKFIANKLMPDSNLRVTVTDTDKVWYFKHMEVRNYLGSVNSLDDFNGKAFLQRGLYSPEGFASIDDSKTLVFTADGSVHKNPNDGIDLYLFIYKNNFGEALKSYFNLTGYPMLIPRYTLGVWWNKNDIYDERSAKNLVSEFYKQEMPISILLLGKKWRTGKDKINSGFTFDKKLFPNAKEFIDKLHKNHIYFGLNINTLDGIQVNEELYQKVIEFTKASSDKSVPINVYDPKYIDAFMKVILVNLENLGVDFFWIDDKDKDFQRLFILNHYLYHNYDKSPKKRGIIVSRNPGIASHRYSILYSGETLVNWKTLRFLPYFNSLSSNIGLSWWSHSIGGYKKGIEDEELYMRYVQLGVFSPIFRFSSEAGHYYKREPWKWDYKTLKICKDYIRIRHRLIPYLYTEAYKYYKYGNTLIQPLYYKYPKLYDEPLYKNEYFFGTELFISPITEPKDLVMNRVVHKVFLPNGEWYDFKSGKKFPGGNRYVTFFKDEDYPVFAKSGSIIPLAILDENNLNDVTPPRKLEIQVFPGRSNQYMFYEDDGISSLYKKEYYIISNINFDYKENNYSIGISPIAGKSGIIPNHRDYKIRFRNTKFTNYVIVNIDNVNAKFNAYVNDNDFIIEVNNVPTTSELEVSITGEKLEIEALRAINEDLDAIINDLKIETSLKEKIANVLFSDLELSKKRIEIKRLKYQGLNKIFIKMFIKLLEYIAEI